ncbi:uncharacterized protein LOC113495389 [Trichoplusia ni]|uniref:Uncharacterized protein LOC113495389 n=1 Tax=Trichoplusia ni TaxID=7111 RepID=A0A7E5VNI1_TRINI|nr:uncharacterized protein LOC113495389 [Trichoplusia ni]
MAKLKYDLPTNTFPYKITRRLNALSVPRRYCYETMEGMPAYTPTGIRKSALAGTTSDRVNDIAWPWIRRLVIIKKQYKNRFSSERLERIDRMIEFANATLYTKLANCVIDLKKQDAKEVKKKRGWTESEWKKHMDYIGQVAAPKKEFKPPPVKRGKSVPLEVLMPRITAMASRPDFKCYKRMSQENWYRNPEKVAPSALKYVLTERTKKLAAPRNLQPQD